MTVLIYPNNHKNVWGRVPQSNEINGILCKHRAQIFKRRVLGSLALMILGFQMLHEIHLQAKESGKPVVSFTVSPEPWGAQKAHLHLETQEQGPNGTDGPIQGEKAIHLLPLRILSGQSVDWMIPTHADEARFLHSICWIKCKSLLQRPSQRHPE